MKTITDRLRRLFKFRFAVWYPVAIYILFFCNINDRTLLPGIVIVMLGVLIRVWANCYAVKMDRLTTSGPYAFVRNPLYLGTAIVMLGVVVLLEQYLLGGIVFMVFALVYYRTIQSEQRMLTEKFGEAFQDYMHNVPAMFPRLSPYSKGEKWPFSWERLCESREHKVPIWIAIAIIVFYLKAKLMIEKEALSDRVVLWMAAVILLVATDFVVDNMRYRLKKSAEG